MRIRKVVYKETINDCSITVNLNNSSWLIVKIFMNIITTVFT